MTINDALPSNIKLDSNQLSAIKLIEEISLSFTPKNKLQFFFKPKLRKYGLYLYGGVGSGKTMLMKAFYDNLKVPATFIHYQDFMLSLHKNLHKLKNNSTHEQIQNLALLYKEQCEILCIDEFEIKDISDAMIIGRLFTELNKCNIFIFLTTNTPPQELYKDGIQRDSFIPFIHYIEKYFTILPIKAEHDYRSINYADISNKILYPTIKMQEQIKNIIHQLTKPSELLPETLEVFGRNIFFASVYKDVLVTDFNELCMQDYGYADYVTICHRFKVIILQDIKKIDARERNLILRFINFIDNAYFYKVLLFATLEDAPESLYQAGSSLKEFQRTISRLQEMNSNSYEILALGSHNR